MTSAAGDRLVDVVRRLQAVLPQDSAVACAALSVALCLWAERQGLSENEIVLAITRTLVFLRSDRCTIKAQLAQATRVDPATTN